MNKYQRREYVQWRVGIDKGTGCPRCLTKQRDGIWTEMDDDGVTIQRDISLVFLAERKDFNVINSDAAYEYFYALKAASHC